MEEQMSAEGAARIAKIFLAILTFPN